MNWKDVSYQYAVRFQALAIMYFSIKKNNAPPYKVQICKVQAEKNRFESPMTQVVGFWSSDFQNEKWHAL